MAKKPKNTRKILRVKPKQKRRANRVKPESPTTVLGSRGASRINVKPTKPIAIDLPPQISINRDKPLQPARPKKPKPKSPVRGPDVVLSGSIKPRPKVIVGSDIVLDTIDTRFRAEAPPLALLPLKLEYRFVTNKKPLLVKDTVDVQRALMAIKANPQLRGKKAKKDILKKKTKLFQAEISKRAKIKPMQIKGREELWFRWYPDESFSEEGIEVVSEDEQKALDRFTATIGSSQWWDTEDETASLAWQTLASNVGAYRALFLVRNLGAPDIGDKKARIGRIALLPRHVSLYAYTKGKIKKLTTGKPIPTNKASAISPVSYMPEALDPGGWLVDFGSAIHNGMGIKITDPAIIKAAKAADWIIAVGIHASDARADIETLLKSHIANGEFGFLPQDTPTNNTPDSLSYHTSPNADLIGFTKRATAAERGDYTTDRQEAADLFAEAFNIDVNLARSALDGADQGFEDAKAMLRVIGPTLLDDNLNGISLVEGVSENAFIEVMGASIVARGVLPAVRFGSNAMGVLPMIKVKDFRVSDKEASTNTGKVHKYLQSYANIMRAFMPSYADRKVPIIQPDDPGASDKFNQILSTNRVSTRLDISDVDFSQAEQVKAIGCPYVSGSATNQKPAKYFQDLRSKTLGGLPDPDETNSTWPLLYRLARITLNRNTISALSAQVLEVKPEVISSGPKLSTAQRKKISSIEKTIKKLSSKRISEMKIADIKLTANVSADFYTKFRRTNRQFVNALKQLEAVAARKDGLAQLEMLMFEVVDLFQHRPDAFATGLAYARLKSNRQNGQQGLKGGYYGMLSKLRPKSNTGQSDGYIQTPSTPQAATAAVLRSAYLRHRGDGAFKLDISSARIRGALSILDLLSKGHALSDCLGLRGERWLHDRKFDRLILPIRLFFPIEGEQKNSIASRRVFDGLKYIDTTPKAPDITIKRQLQSYLKDTLDALSDVIMAEAVHQRALGQVEAANAWLQVLSGDAPPGIPTFLRTQRHGQGSSYRVSFVEAEVKANTIDSPRALAEPLVAQMAKVALPDFEQTILQLIFTNDQNNSQNFDINIATDLAMSPIDFVIGGVSELQVRAKAFVGRLVSRKPSLINLPANANGEDIKFTINFEAGTHSLSELIDSAEKLRSTIQNGRPLEPTDINAAALADAGELSEAQQIKLKEYAIGVLHDRAGKLERHITNVIAAVKVPFQNFQREIFETRRCMDAEEPQSVVDLCVVRAKTASQSFEDSLVSLAVFGVPEALRPISLLDSFKDPSGAVAKFSKIISSVDKKRKNLTEILLQATNGFTTQPAANGSLQKLSEALKLSLDGDAFPVLPPFPRSGINLRADVGPSITVTNALGNWVDVRKNVKAAASFAEQFPGMRAFSTTEAATITTPDPNDDNVDPRPESSAPRSYHFGVFLGKEATITGLKSVAGIVCDEWTEQRPSEEQMAGVAVNYDSPQSEAPHCILLAIPPSPSFKLWTENNAAELVAETIQWTKVRSLASHDVATTRSMFPSSNVVSNKLNKGGSKRRIPRQSIYTMFTDVRIGVLMSSGLANAAASISMTASDLPERRGFQNVKE